MKFTKTKVGISKEIPAFERGAYIHDAIETAAITEAAALFNLFFI